jgi:hypothetical protein
MPERGWCSLTVKEGRARRVGEEAEARGLSVDELVSSFMAQGSRSSWLARRTCGARVKPEDMDKHVARVHPKR